MPDRPTRKDTILSEPGTPAIIEQYPEHARLIGSIIAEWSRIEHNLVLLLAATLETDAAIIRPMIYATESSRGRLQALRAAFEVKMRGNARVLGEMQKMLDEVGAVLTQRNKFAHALYGISGTGELSILGVKSGEANDLPIHDLEHQFERTKKLCDLVAMLLGTVMGLYDDQRSAPD